MRDEHLLNATILRYDPKKFVPGVPVDALTPESGGSYDPSSADAPLKIFATGVRNAYDCCWHSNGHLYVPTNGSSAGGNAPAGGGALPIKNVSTAEDDWLFKIAPGKFHGHPNPTQGHFVLNGGNPTAAYDFAESFQYPVGTQPDPDYTPPAYSFGKHVSSNGVIEYVGNAFGGKLNHKLLVCRYNVGSDIIALTLDKDGNVIGDAFGFPGMSQLVNPLDITEDRRAGNLYVSEYGALRITLIRPQ
jgi:glucose/arabinose dehydrogenase